jgi:serine/threonine-protein kinase
VPSAPPDAEAWKTLAAGAPDLDPGATVTAAVYAATLQVPRASSPQGATITLPELPLLVVDRLDEGVPPSGATDADFEVTGVLGEGGMGKVLLARQRSLRREVAIKVVKGDGAHEDTIEALLAEALVTGSVEHPGVIPVHVLGRDAVGRPVLVMKRIEGVSWKDLARDPDHALWSTIAPDAGDRLDAHLEILLAVCSAAHCAHARGIVHRDIKLDNVMIGPFGEVYLVDWGIAMRLPGPGSLLPRGPGGPVGTPAYMAPEMVRADLAQMDARTDVFLLGATLHHLLTGEPRHRGGSILEVLRAALASPPFAYPPHVPAELAALCNRATAASPAARFPSALDLRQALASFRRHRGSIALGDQASARLAEVPDSGDPRKIHGMLTECRYGFMQALRAWPENAAARAGLARCLVSMIDHEIRQRDAAGARALLSELSDPEEHRALLPRIEALEAELGAARDREAALARIERDGDLSIGGRTQLAFLAVLPLLSLAVLIYIRERGTTDVRPGEVIAIPALILVALLGAGAVARRRLDTAISRKAMAQVILLVAAVLVHRLVSTALSAPIPVMIAGDLVIGATIGASVAISLVPRAALIAAVPLLGAAGMAARPDLAVPIFSVVAVISPALLLLLWRRLVQPAPRRP